MKTIILCSSLLFFIAWSSIASSDNESAVKKTILDFSKAGDANNTEKLDKILHSDYRIIMNRLFGSKEVSIMNKAQYIKKIESKEWGGDKRVVNVETIIFNENSASAIVAYKGEKMSWKSIIHLVNSENNEWLIISETPKM